MTDIIKAVREQAKEEGRQEERAAIVAWLRKDRPFWDLSPLADEVEAGGHLK